MNYALAIGLALVACRDAPKDDPVCSCIPGNVSRVTNHDGSRMTGDALLGLLRRHRRDVEHGRNARDIKVDDDQLRFAVANFCDPCNVWVEDRMTIDTLFPLARLDEASGAVCLGLVLRDGSMVYGDARPRACR